jgi:hypothetical protein
MSSVAVRWSIRRECRGGSVEEGVKKNVGKEVKKEGVETAQ